MQNGPTFTESNVTISAVIYVFTIQPSNLIGIYPKDTLAKKKQKTHMHNTIHNSTLQNVKIKTKMPSTGF